MKRILLVMLLITTPALAENWINYDLVTMRVIMAVRTDCFSSGFCGPNNTNIQDGWIEATPEEFYLAKEDNKKVNLALAVGSRVIDMTQTEINAYLAEVKTTLDAEKTQRTNNLDVTIKDAFTAWLKVYNSKVPPQYRVTGAELIQQLKTDQGI